MKAITPDNLRKLLLQAWLDGREQGRKDTRRQYQGGSHFEHSTTSPADLIARDEKFTKTIDEVTP